MTKTNITVNGKPLEEVIKDQTTEELRSVHQAESRKNIRQPIISKHGNNVHRVRAGAVKQLPQDERATHVIVAGMEFPWKEKWPYVQSGYSAQGALEKDSLTGTVKCHECGVYRSGLHSHIVHAHNMTTAEYKKRHGFRVRTNLVGEKNHSRISNITNWRKTKTVDELAAIEAKRQERSKTAFVVRKFIPRPSWGTETANLHSRCLAQLEQRTKELAINLGRTPTARELKASGIYLDAVTRNFGIPANEFIHSIGLIPNKATNSIIGRRRQCQ